MPMFYVCFCLSHIRELVPSYPTEVQGGITSAAV